MFPREIEILRYIFSLPREILRYIFSLFSKRKGINKNIQNKTTQIQFFPREIVRYIFSFQEIYWYFCISNTLYSLKKIKETLSTFHPPDKYPLALNSLQQMNACTLPITKNKAYYIQVWYSSPFF